MMTTLYWYIGCAFIFGILFCVIVQKIGRQIFSVLWGKASIIKKYWIFVMIFIAVYSVLYYLVLGKSLFLPAETALRLDFLGHMSALTFAIFVGYFAFLQVTEGRLDRLKSEGHGYLKLRRYKRAKECWEQANAIRRDFNTLANLVELYVIMQDQNRFAIQLRELEKMIMEEQERTIVIYLKLVNHLFREEIRAAKDELQSLIAHVKPDRSRNAFLAGWSFQDLLHADGYKKLQGEARSILDNFIKYANGTLKDARLKTFEEGEFVNLPNDLDSGNDAAVKGKIITGPSQKS